MNVLVFHHQGFGYGSTEKLMRQMAKMLNPKFKVIFAYGPEADRHELAQMLKLGITAIPFCYHSRQSIEPFSFKGMQPGLSEMLEKYNIQCVFTNVFAHYQFPINSIPAGIPLVLISPFGHYCSNGNVVKTYVSGRENLERLHQRGVRSAELLYNPLEDYAAQYLQKSDVGQVIKFGRIGRGEDSIFDPIAVKAFKKLEDFFPGRVKYIVVNPPPAWETLAKNLNIKNMEFRPAITEKIKLAEFYKEIDVLAHARKDGETLGMAIAEAMLAGNPILTHRSNFHNDHFDILDPSYAKWCQADDWEQYFENMRWMVQHQDRIRPMGQLARKRALQIFSLETQIPKIIDDFTEACKHYYHNSFFGKAKGYSIVYWRDLLMAPFLLGKFITYKFPKTYSSLRRLFPR